MKIREMAGAFLFYGDQLLLMQRAENRRLAPGLWGPVGGHVEPHELGDPEAACRREIAEETGLGADDLLDLTLKFIVLRREGEEIRLHYLYMGQANTLRVENRTAEGTLHWVKEQDVCKLKMSFTVKCALEHWLAHRPEGIVTGTVSAVDGKPVMHWNALDHWDGMQ